MAGVKYAINDNVDEIRELGYLSVPVLIVDGNDMNFKEACVWADGMAGVVNAD